MVEAINEVGDRIEALPFVDVDNEAMLLPLLGVTKAVAAAGNNTRAAEFLEMIFIVRKVC